MKLSYCPVIHLKTLENSIRSVDSGSSSNTGPPEYKAAIPIRYGKAKIRSVKHALCPKPAINVKVKLFLCLTKYHATETCRDLNYLRSVLIQETE
jgi:hypothetical protein